MTRRPKYRAVHVYWDSLRLITLERIDVACYRTKSGLKLPKHIWRFDSIHEFRVYLQLVRMYGADRVKRQVAIQVISPCLCYPRGKFWRVDFAITKSITDRDIYCLVEAKGAFLPEFASILVNLEREDKDVFKRTYIVFPSQVPKKNLVVKALLKSFFSKNLITLTYLNRLRDLP